MQETTYKQKLNIQKPAIKINIRARSGFTQTERINFFRDLSLVLSSGISIIQAFDVLEDQVKSTGVKEAFRVMAKDMENGTALSSAMSKFPKYFPRHIVETIWTAEYAGTLNPTLLKISEDLQKNYVLRKKVIAALAYPVTVLFVMLAVVTALIVYVLPQVAILFSELGAELPLITRTILAIGLFAETHMLLLSAILAALIAISVYALSTAKGRHLTHTLALKIPVFKELIKDYNRVLFFRAIHSMTTSGISVVRAVDIAKKNVKNDTFRKAAEAMHPSLLHGVGLGEALEPYPHLFPRQITKMINVGEQTGNLDEALKRIVDHYEHSAGHRADMLTVMIEPILMLIAGAAVGLLALSIFLPIYQTVNLF